MKRTLRQREIIEDFLTKWKREYLTSLREFHKAHGDNGKNIQVRDAIKIQVDSLRSLWNIGVV